MDEENKKINLESFFKRVDSVEQIANSALSKANSNLGINNNQKSLIESLSISIEAMQTKIRDIANYIIVERKIEADREEDRRLESEDAEQKKLMTERATAMGQQGPQKESVKPSESQAGGGSFLGGLVQTLGGLMAGGFALKYIGPVLLPKLLLLAKTKLFPLIGAGLKTAITTSFKFIGGALSKGFLPLVGLTLIGKAFKPIVEGIKGTFDGVSNFFAGKIDSIFKEGGGDTGVSSDSNMNATDPTVTTDMTDTLKKEGLVEDQKNDGGKEEINTEIQEYYDDINELKKESNIAKETEKTEISGELRQEASGGDEKLSEEVGETFKVIKGEKDKSIKDLEREYAAGLAKVQKMKDEGANAQRITSQERKVKNTKFILDRKKKEMGLLEIDENLSDSLIEAGMGEGKSSYSATTKYQIIEPIEKRENEASGGDELANVEVGNKFKVTEGKKEKTLEELESKYARLLAKIQKMKDEGRNSEIIGMEEDKAGLLKFTIQEKKAEMGLIEDKGIGKSLIESGMGEGKSSYSATTKYKFVEPIKKEIDNLSLSLSTNLETSDKLVNAASYQSGIQNKDQNSSVVVQNQPAQVTIASIKKTSSPVAFIKSNKNKFLSINETELPPEVLRMIT